MSRYVKETPCEHGYGFEMYHCDHGVVAEPGDIGHDGHGAVCPTSSWCDGGERVLLEPAEPDYEAALTEYLHLVWAKDGFGPYAEKLADEVLPNGVKVPRISNFEEAKRIVDAALAGVTLLKETDDEPS